LSFIGLGIVIFGIWKKIFVESRGSLFLLDPDSDPDFPRPRCGFQAWIIVAEQRFVKIDD
jgi:hypothetical protein